MKIAERIATLPPYVFAGIERRIAAARASGVDVINLGIGSPDLAPDPAVTEALVRSARRDDTHGYAGYFGTPALRGAIAGYYRARFGVELDADREILPLLGSKEGLVNITLAFVDAEDVVLAPDPGYPVYRMGALLAGGSFHALPLRPERGWLPDLSAVPGGILARATLLWLNYPNNPTGAVAPREFLAEAVAFCRHHDLLLCYDNAYCDITYDGYVAPSVMEVPGARDVAVEFNSLSKTYNMAGWRVGMAVGNAEALRALSTVKTNVDSGIFYPVQEAAVAALTGDAARTDERIRIYQRRRDQVLAWLPRAGLQAERPLGGLYVWARVPEAVEAERWAIDALERCGVWLTPGTAFGAHGQGYLRIALCTSEERLREAGERLSAL